MLSGGNAGNSAQLSGAFDTTVNIDTIDREITDIQDAIDLISKHPTLNQGMFLMLQNMLNTMAQEGVSVTLDQILPMTIRERKVFEQLFYQVPPFVEEGVLVGVKVVADVFSAYVQDIFTNGIAPETVVPLTENRRSWLISLMTEDGTDNAGNVALKTDGLYTYIKDAWDADGQPATAENIMKKTDFNQNTKDLMDGLSTSTPGTGSFGSGLLSGLSSLGSALGGLGGIGAGAAAASAAGEAAAGLVGAQLASTALQDALSAIIAGTQSTISTSANQFLQDVMSRAIDGLLASDPDNICYTNSPFLLTQDQKDFIDGLDARMDTDEDAIATSSTYINDLINGTLFGAPGYATGVDLVNALRSVTNLMPSSSELTMINGMYSNLLTQSYSNTAVVPMLLTAAQYLDTLIARVTNPNQLAIISDVPPLNARTMLNAMYANMLTLSAYGYVSATTAPVNVNSVIYLEQLRARVGSQANIALLSDIPTTPVPNAVIMVNNMYANMLTDLTAYGYGVGTMVPIDRSTLIYYEQLKSRVGAQTNIALLSDIPASLISSTDVTYLEALMARAGAQTNIALLSDIAGGGGGGGASGDIIELNFGNVNSIGLGSTSQVNITPVPTVAYFINTNGKLAYTTGNTYVSCAAGKYKLTLQAQQFTDGASSGGVWIYPVDGSNLTFYVKEFWLRAGNYSPSNLTQACLFAQNIVSDATAFTVHLASICTAIASAASNIQLRLTIEQL